MAMTLELIARCPFCGSESEIRNHPNALAHCGAEMGQPGVDAFFVHCDGCGCDGPVGSSEGDAIDLWNQRAHLTQPAQAVDVVAIEAVIRELRTWPADATPYTYRTTCAEAVAKLTAALPTSPTPDKEG